MNVCVLTATRGTSVHLDATVASVRALGGAGRHVLVCPAAVRDGLARRFPALEVVAETGAGLYAALNTGLAQVRAGEALTWVNDDDLLCGPGFTAALARLGTAASAGIVYGRVGLIDAAGARLGELPVARRPADLRPLIAGGIMPLAQPGTVFAAGLVQRLGGFDEGYRLAGDLALFGRALRAGADFAFVDAEVARFRLLAGQLSKDVAAAAAEHTRAIAGLDPAGFGGARWRFRWDNRGVYLERVRRHGFVRMSSLYRHA